MEDWEFWLRAFVLISVFLYRKCTHVILGILAIGLFVFAFVIIKGIYACKTWHFEISLCV